MVLAVFFTIRWVRHCCLMLLALMSALVALAQAGNAPAPTAVYFSDDSVKVTVYNLLKAMAREMKVDDLDFEARFSGKREALFRRISPDLEKAMATMGANKPASAFPKPGTPAYRKWKEGYTSSIQAILLAALEKDSELAGLVIPDNSDRILIFHSEVEIDSLGTYTVKEYITVYNGDGTSGTSGLPSTNDDIQRGITREFPTSYQDKHGLISKVGFELLGVYKEDNPAPYHTERLSNGIRVLVGERDVFIPQGIHRYRFEYKTSRQLIFHDNKDECYWNINGNGWVFTVDSISCRLRFPAGATIGEKDCYTGLQGSVERDCDARLLAPNEVWFRGRKLLKPYEGMTVAAAIQKGVIATPGKTGNILLLLKDNFILPLMALFVVGMFLFDFLAWRRHGRDPEKGIIYPQFAPPADITPADAGYILEQKYQPRLFAAALVDCAVKNQLKIDVTREGWLIKSTVYHFSQPGNAKTKQAFSGVSAYDFNPSEFYGKKIQAGEYDPFIAGKNKALKAKLESRFRIRRGQSNTWKGLFKLNNCFTISGFMFLLAAAFGAFVFVVVYNSWQILLWIAALWLLALIIHLVFAGIMSAYTSEGRAIADHLEGFKMYLETAEQKVFEHFTPPEKTLELFEKYLPYAIALGVENSWAEKFESIIQQAMEAGYQPSYYGGRHSFGDSFAMSDMSRSLSAGLSSTISSASTPPSSSSGGSSGGGSSGGGGGGGGGGGW